MDKQSGELQSCVAVNTNDIDHIKTAIDDIKKMLEAGDKRMDGLELRQSRTEQTLYGVNGDPGLVKSYAETEKTVDGLRIKIYGIGAAATAIGVIIGYVITWVTGSK